MPFSFIGGYMIKKPSEITWIDLANRALSRLNMNLISSFDEGSNSALQTELCLSGAVGEVLGMNDWKSATKRAILVPNVTTTVDGQYVYNFPNDYVRLVSVDLDPSIWGREGHGLVCIVSREIPVKYVAFPSSPQTLDPLLQSAISLMAAYKMSLVLTADTALQQQLFAEAQAAIAQARLNETQGEPDILISTNDWKKEY